MVGQAPEMERGIAFSRLWIVWRKKSERKKQTMKIIPKLIPPAEVNLLAATVLQSAKAFYADPHNEARYQAWKAERERKGVNHYGD